MAKEELLYSSIPITKSEKQADGTLMVYGLATDDSVDYDKQICDPNWLASAMPKWFKDSGNVREQHSSIAAGVAKNLENEGNRWYATVHVVDPVSVLKVEKGVLKEFSIGIRNARVIKDAVAKGGRIVDGMISELSLVDRGANMNAKFVIAKALDGNTELEEVGAEEVVETPAEEAVEIAADTETVVEGAETVEVPAETIITSPDANEAAEVAKEVEVAADEVQSEKSLTASDIIKMAQDVAALNKGVDDVNATDFQNAKTALANLLSSEAQDFANGMDEQNSLNALIGAIGYLLQWEMGESWEATAEKLFGTKKIEEDSLTPELVKAIDKAVTSATESILKEVTTLTESNETLKKALDEKEAELQTALGKAMGGGAKRTQLQQGRPKQEHLSKALEFRQKAAKVTDPALRRGYLDRAAEEEALAKQ